MRTAASLWRHPKSCLGSSLATVTTRKMHLIPIQAASAILYSHHYSQLLSVVLALHTFIVVQVNVCEPWCADGANAKCLLYCGVEAYDEPGFDLIGEHLDRVVRFLEEVPLQRNAQPNPKLKRGR